MNTEEKGADSRNRHLSRNGRLESHWNPLEAFEVTEEALGFGFAALKWRAFQWWIGGLVMKVLDLDVQHCNTGVEYIVMDIGCVWSNG